MQRALRTRDDGLGKVSTVTRVLVVGAVAATGLFATLAALAQPVRASIASAATGQRTGAGGAGTRTRGRASGIGASSGSANSNPSTAASGSGVGSGDGSGASLTPPAALPDPGYQYTAPVVVSGAS